MHVRYLRTLGLVALLTTLGSVTASAQQVKTVFVIALENHNWTQPAVCPGCPEQIFQNVNAPFINSLVNGTATAVINGQLVNISEQVSYAAAYHNVLSTASGMNPDIHPSEPNYLWAEAGTNFGILNDNDPFSNPPTYPNLQNTPLHLATLLAQSGQTWKSYQEDIDLTPSGPNLTNVPLPQAEWTTPLASFSGNFVSGTNAYNGSKQYNYAAKHNPMVFFSDANGGAPPNFTNTNPATLQYAPLQQLSADLANDAVANYNWITPDQYNDMHTALTGGFTYQGTLRTGDAANIAQGDNFVSQVIPMIMASNAYQNHGVIVIWWDESEGNNPGSDDFTHTIGEIVISERAHPNVNGLPYASPVNFTHSSDLRTWQNIFRVGPYLGDAANATDLSDLFKPGVVPKKP